MGIHDHFLQATRDKKEVVFKHLMTGHSQTRENSLLLIERRTFKIHNAVCLQSMRTCAGLVCESVWFLISTGLTPASSGCERPLTRSL